MNDPDKHDDQRIRRLIPPDDLKKAEPLFWSSGIGTDVWELFLACFCGDLYAVKRLIAKAPALVRCHYEYRTPLSFAVRENWIEIAAYLIDHGADLI